MQFIRMRSGLGQSALHRALDSLDAVAVDPSAAGSAEELGLAWHLAARAFGGGKNIANKMRYEFLLWLAGKRDIRSAMQATSPAVGEFVVVWFSGAGESDVCSALEGKKLPLGLPQEGEPLRLERISLSRLRG